MERVVTTSDRGGGCKYMNMVNNNADRLTMEELSLFSYQLSLIMKSGLPYLEGLELMKDELEDGRLKKMAGRLYEDVREGKKLHESLKAEEAFPKYFVQMTEIAEKSGMLDIEMERLSIFYDRQEELRYKIRSAMVYPLVLFFLMAAVLAILVLKVFPVFQEVLSSLGGNLPSSSTSLMGIVESLQKVAIWIMALILLAIIGLYFYTRSKKGESWLDSYKLRSKLLGGFYKRLVTLRFSQGMSMMLKAGIPFEDAMVLSAPLTENKHAEKEILSVQDKIHKGESVPDAIQSSDIFPGLFKQMLKVGVKSGQVDSSFERLSEIYEVELERATARLTSSIEPTLVIILSLVVGIVLLTVMLPMIEIMSSIG